MTLPIIAIQICTYNRYDEIRATLEALQQYLIYPEDRIRLYICDDSSPDNYLSRLKRLKIFKKWSTIFISTSSNSGWGANVNNGLREIPEDIIFFLEDDYVLTRPLDLRVGVSILQSLSHIGMIRYRGTSGDRMLFHQFEATIDVEEEYREATSQVFNRAAYLQIDRASPTVYLYSHGPHLKHRSFHDSLGLYDEGLRLGETEERFAHKVKNAMLENADTAPGIIILPEWIPMHWDHIGQSYQHTDEDIVHD